jgi:hypothetical protein
MKNKKDTTIFLKRMGGKESDEIYQLSQGAIVIGDFLQDMQLKGEKPVAFVQRLLWLSKCFYTIRLQHDPTKIIGYSLLYKKAKTFYSSFCVLPTPHYLNIVDQAREQLIRLAKFSCGVTDVKDTNSIHYANAEKGNKSLLVNHTVHRVA